MLNAELMDVSKVSLLIVHVTIFRLNPYDLILSYMETLLSHLIYQRASYQ